MILPALLVGSGLKLKSRRMANQCPPNSPGFIGREWIETAIAARHCNNPCILPALLVGSGLKPTFAAGAAIAAQFSRLYWSGVD